MNRKVRDALGKMDVGSHLDVWEAAKVIVKEQSEGAVPHLLELMDRSHDTERKVAAAWALGLLRNAMALDVMIRILNDPSEPPALRDQAAESLGYLSDSKAHDVLVKNLTDHSVDVVFSCVFALRSLGRRDDIPYLEELAHDSSRLNSYGSSLAREAREAIEQIKRTSPE